MSGAALQSPRELLAARGELGPDVIAVRCGGRIVDLHTGVPGDSEVRPIRRGDPDGLEIIRHSTSHVMAQAVQRLFPGTQVTIGPAIEHGFYYDFSPPEGVKFTDQDLGRIEDEMRRLMKADLPFRREVLPREDVRALFGKMGERFKLELVDAIPEGREISIYRQGDAADPGGDWLDLCSGPHVPSTRHLGVVKLTSVAGAYWRGDERNPMLQRIYGTAFATEADLKAHLQMLEEARARDHRKLGKELELFLFDESAPAMPFFLPRGAFVYNQLVAYVRDLYQEHGYQEVITPQIFHPSLFETSGHLQNYRENMYFPATSEDLAGTPAEGAEPVHVQKPMNCPSHCLIFGQRRRSYRELPWRIADFGRLHRFERGGVVHGLTRVRSFSQDDAHIFCAPEQLRDEALAFNRLLFEVYRAFGFEHLEVKLALRPERRVGDDALWDTAENTLRGVLQESGLTFEELPGEGAFYGPKVEFHVKDAIGRSWQLGTIQLDYALPERFDLEFVGADGKSRRPVMLHRAILGSLERFLGIYIEHVAGKFPVWLAPEQVILVTVSENQVEYARRVQSELRAAGLRVELDDGPDKLGAKIRSARLRRVPFVGVIGEKEAQAGAIAPKGSDGKDLGAMPVAEFQSRLLALARPPRAGAAGG